MTMLRTALNSFCLESGRRSGICSEEGERTMAELIAQMETGQLQNENLERLVLELTQRLQSTKGKKV